MKRIILITILLMSCSKEYRVTPMGGQAWQCTEDTLMGYGQVGACKTLEECAKICEEYRVGVRK